MELTQLNVRREFLGHSVRIGNPCRACNFSESKNQSWDSGKNRLDFTVRNTGEETADSKDSSGKPQRVPDNFQLSGDKETLMRKLPKSGEGIA